MTVIKEADDTLSWVEGCKVNSLIKPALALRIATDQNYILNHSAYLTGYSYAVNAKAMMNAALPGMRIPGVISWNVTESLDNVISTASFEAFNALPISQISTTLSTSLPAQWHSPTVLNHYVNAGGVGVAELGGSPIWAYGYSEDQILFRKMSDEVFTVASGASFPDPAIPNDEADGQNYWPQSSNGIGSYYVLIDNEVIRVHNKSGNSFAIPPGGRGANGVIEAHSPGATVYLLGYGPWTGKWTGLGYLTAHDSAPYRSPLRPGTCLTSYEGYGNFAEAQALSKAPWSRGSRRNYCFTGYWFTTNQESSLGADGKATITVDLSSSASVLDAQINEDTIRRVAFEHNKLSTVQWDEAGHYRNITGDAVDFNYWDPQQPASYPLQIKTTHAQNKAFFDHMGETTYGKDCPLCMKEYYAWIATHGTDKNPNLEQRQVGRHIFRESIRVYNAYGTHVDDPGPLRTFGKLMMYFAKLAYENRAISSNPLGQRFTKIPNALWTNMNSWQDTGRVWKGALAFAFEGDTSYSYSNVEDWAENFYNIFQEIPDKRVLHYTRQKLLCPFETTYDKQSWLAPIQDIANMNNMTFYLTRDGYPIFSPAGFKLRGRSHLVTGSANGEWTLSWGESIRDYAHNIDINEILTKIYVQGTTCFGGTFTVPASGTSFNMLTGELIWHSSEVGNVDALRLTGGNQKTDTLALDNVSFGLDWDTNMATLGGVKIQKEGQGPTYKFAPPWVPPAYVSTSYQEGQDAPRGEDIKLIQKMLNWFLLRRYINYPYVGDYTYYSLDINGIYGPVVAATVARLQAMLNNADKPGGGKYLPGPYAVGVYGKTLVDAIRSWLNDNAEYVRTDVWWYALSGYPWEYYLAAVSGITIPLWRNPDFADVAPEDISEDDMWSTNQLAFQESQLKWQQQFYRQALMLGNAKVDGAINRSSVRKVSSSYADPRIEIGDVLWLRIPGFLSETNITGTRQPPFDHGLYVTQISRTMDLTSGGSYTATYSGYRYRGSFNESFETDLSNYWAS